MLNKSEENLRPKLLKDYIGQENVSKTLKMFIDAVNKRGKPSEHILFYGPPGIGKTTLAYIVANELKGEMKVTSGATITKTATFCLLMRFIAYQNQLRRCFIRSWKSIHWT